MMPLIEINYDIYTLVVIHLPETLTGSQWNSISLGTVNMELMNNAMCLG